MRGNKVKFALPFALQHYAEYFVYVEPNRNKDGKVGLEGDGFLNSELTDMDANSKGEQIGHKIKVTMKDSSCGPKGRVGQFTLDYRKGIINQWEEVWTLCYNRGVIENPKLGSYKFKEREWRGKESVWEDLKKDPKLCEAMVEELFARDQAGAYDAHDRAAAENDE
jgi:hypothetical protein